MRAFVLHAKAGRESWPAALRGQGLATLAWGGWAVDDRDRDAAGVRSVLTADARRGHHEMRPDAEPVAERLARLRAADGPVPAFQVWRWGSTAILKGCPDRLFLPREVLRSAHGTVWQNRTHICGRAAATPRAAGRPRAPTARDPSRRCLAGPARHVCRSRKMRYLMGRDTPRDVMAGADAAGRPAFRGRVGQGIEAL